MKRIILACLVLMLTLSLGGHALLTPASASAEPSEPTYASLEQAIAGYLDSQDYTYHHDEEEHFFYYSMTATMSDLPDGCDVYISYDEEGFLVESYLPVKPDLTNAKTLAAIHDFMARANYALNLGKFQMNHEDGEISYMTSAMYFDRVPSQRELEWLVDIPALMIDKYGDAMKRVIEDGADPATEFEAADQAEQPEPGLPLPKGFVLPKT